MCYPVPCSNCEKTTWAGCGDHVAEVMVGIPDHGRCACAKPVPVG